MSEELKQIKKIYGEEMMHLCRDLFPTILEEPGKLLEILVNNFAPTKSLAKDLYDSNYNNEFKEYIFSMIKDDEQEVIETNKTPFELMDEAGYVLYECKSEEDIQRFRKYYKDNEVLCTIKNGGRLKRCHVFFAVKKNVDEIRRESFLNPEREDEYGTSVISIQFSRGSRNSLSIKNRYNHTVFNPDATFNNNLENIIPGLTESFEKYYGFNIDLRNIKSNINNYFLSKMKYVLASDGKYYRFNLETNGIYYCENNIIIKDGKVIKDYTNNKERYLLIENAVVDLQEKTIFDPFANKKKRNSFIDSINDVGEIKKIDVTKNNENRLITIKYKDDKEIKIEINGNNSVVSYENNYVTTIGDEFLFNNNSLLRLSLNNVIKTGKYFLYNNYVLHTIEMDKLEETESHFLEKNRDLTEISFPSLKIIGEYFIPHNSNIRNFKLPKAEIIKSNFLAEVSSIMEIILPEVIEIYDNFLPNLTTVAVINMPKVKSIGNNFLRNVMRFILRKLSLPNVIKIGSDFMKSVGKIDEVYMPKAKKVGERFLQKCRSFAKIYAPNLKNINTSNDIGFVLPIRKK